MPTMDFIVAGVGGQGSLLASDVIAEVGLAQGLDVKKSDVHGMAQRGGAVISHVRWGDQVASPLVERGRADVLIALELIESLRWLDFLRPGGAVLVNRQQIRPSSTVLGGDVYPDEAEVLGRLHQVAGQVIIVEGTRIADDLGNARAMNAVVLGALSALLGIDSGHWLEALLARVPQKAVDLNRAAFLAGVQAGVAR